MTGRKQCIYTRPRNQIYLLNGTLDLCNNIDIGTGRILHQTILEAGPWVCPNGALLLAAHVGMASSTSLHKHTDKLEITKVHSCE